MPIFGEKPFTSITVKVNQLCTANRNSDLEDDSIELYVDDLISLIKLQSMGAVEAARAVRKKIKYGNTPAELVLALDLLELLVLNAGSKIGQTIASDDKLTELLRGVVSGLARSGLGGPYDGLVVRRARELAQGWKYELRDLKGYLNFAGLYKSAPKLKQRTFLAHTSSLPQQEVFGDDSGDEIPVRRPESRDPASGSKSPPPPRPIAMSPYAMKSYLNKDDKPGKRSKKKSSKKTSVVYADEQYKIPQINYKVEAPKIRTTIADCHTHTKALENALLALPRGGDPMDDSKASAEFEKCRKIRRKVLRYLQYVGAGDGSHKTPEVLALDEEFLGSLIVANEQLVAAFQKFDEMCGFTPENPALYHQDDRRDEESASSEESYYSSDSEEEEEEDDALARRLNDVKVHEASSKLEAITSSQPESAPIRPPQVKRQDTAISTESGDPFGDRNEVSGNKSVYY